MRNLLVPSVTGLMTVQPQLSLTSMLLATDRIYSSLFFVGCLNSVSVDKLYSVKWQVDC
jgi:hypothetical protein